MLEWLTVLELTVAALAVLGVLHVISRMVNRSRAKARVPASGNTGPVEVTAITTPSPRNEIPAASRMAAGRSAPSAKPRVAGRSRLKSAVRVKTPLSLKTKRPKRDGAARGRRIAFATVAKAKPAMTRRPKRVTQIRRKKIVGFQKRTAAADKLPRRFLSGT